MSARLVFHAGIRAGGEIKNLTFAWRERKGWFGLDQVDGDSMSYPRHRDLAAAAIRDVNALLHAGIPLEGLAIAARISSSNHAEIIRSAWEAVQAHQTSLKSFAA